MTLFSASEGQEARVTSLLVLSLFPVFASAPAPEPFDRLRARCGAAISAAVWRTASRISPVIWSVFAPELALCTLQGRHDTSKLRKDEFRALNDVSLDVKRRACGEGDGKGNLPSDCKWAIMKWQLVCRERSMKCWL